MILSRSLIGLNAFEVRITAVMAPDETLEITGLPDAAKRESAVRVRASLAHLGLRIGAKVTIEPNQGPGGSAHLDLAIAFAVIEAHGLCSSAVPRDAVILGELSFAGDVRPIRGVGPLLAQYCPPAVVPADNEAEVSRLPGEFYAVGSLRQLLDGDLIPARHVAPEPATRASNGIVLVGAPGSGTTLIARQLAASLAFEPSAEVDSIYSVAGILPPEGFVSRCPFRAPHHTVSEAGLVGGGTVPRPGEVSLAHRGVLFLDEITEFRKPALDALFRAVRLGRVDAIRGGQSCSFPARPALVVGASENTRYLGALLEHYSLTPVPIERGFLLAQAIRKAGAS